EDHIVSGRKPRRPPPQDLLEPSTEAVDRTQVGAYDGDPHAAHAMPPSPPPSSPDPTLVRRARIAKLTGRGQQLGYGLLGLAIVVFVVGAAAGLTTAVVVTVVACLAL